MQLSTYTAPQPARRFVRVIGAALLAVTTALGLSLLTAAPTLAHDKLVNYSTPDGAVRLTFNNEVLDVGAEILVTDTTGTDVTDGDPEIVGPDVTQALLPDLADGEYTVDWRVVSSDGHPIEGLLIFTVTGGEIATIAPLAETDEDTDHDHADEAEDHADHDHDGDEHADHDHADHDHADEASTGPGAATVIAVAIGALIIVGGAIAATTVRSRRKRAAAAQTPSDTEEHSQPSQD